MSGTKCALPGANINALSGGNAEAGSELLEILQKEGDTDGFDGKWSDLTLEPPKPAPEQYYFKKFASNVTYSAYWVSAMFSESVTAVMSLSTHIG